MFRLIVFISLIFIFQSCIESQTKSSNSTKKNEKIFNKKDTAHLKNKTDWQNGFGSTHNTELDTIWKRPVKYYIDNPKCSQIAKDFYLGKFRPTDNDSTSELLALATSEIKELRPFYRWCLNKTIQIQDGALAEYTGIPARKYIEKFPREFFEYIDTDITNGKYIDWTSSVAYSGFYDEDDYKKSIEIKIRMTKNIKSNFKDLDNNLKSRIEKLVEDCF